MANKSLRAVVAAISLSLALTPISFAQGSGAAPVTVAQANDTVPLPGAKVAGAALGLTPFMVAVVIGAAILAGVIVSNGNKDDDEAALLAAFRASQATGTR